MYEVTMPKLSDSMEEGKIIEWKVREGDRVKEGDVLAEVESDKAVMELECFQSGVVQRIMRGDGEEAAVGEVIATIVEGEEGEGRRKEQEHEHEQEQEHEEEQDKEEEKEQEQEKEKEKEKVIASTGSGRRFSLAVATQVASAITEWEEHLLYRV